jgi:hypothetical protein
MVTVGGGVYNPLGEMLPTIGLRDQLMAEEAPNTVAVNCCVIDGGRVICDGLMLMEIGLDGLSVMEAVAILFGSARLATVRMTVCSACTKGAV